MVHDLADVEEHLQTLAAPLGVPDHASATVSPLHRQEGCGYGLVDCMELVVLGETLDNTTAFV